MTGRETSDERKRNMRDKRETEREQIRETKVLDE